MPSNINKNKSCQIDSLWSIVNKCKTMPGKRLLRHRLLHPIYDSNELISRYNDIDSVLQLCNKTKKEKYQLYQEKLNEIIDIERFHRRISLRILQPMELFTLFDSYKSIKQLILDIKIQNNTFSSFSSVLLNNENNMLNQCITKITNTFNINELACAKFESMTNSYFKKGVHEDIDQIQQQIHDIHAIIQQSKTSISQLIVTHLELSQTKSHKTKHCFVKLLFNERDGHHYSLTKKRFNIFKSILESKNIKTIYISDSVSLSIDDMKSNQTKNEVKLKFKTIQTLSSELVDLEKQMLELSVEKYKDFLASFYSKFHIFCKDLVIFTSTIDVICCSAQNAMEYGYSKPQIETSNSSFVSCTDIRHAIIERIQKDVSYVSNSITLGRENETKGILLYGVNASGKSSLMKSIAIAIIMAQAGFFVPAKYFIYSPFTKIFTRLTKDDNLFKGQSSFAVEISELRNILVRSDENSIVYGDELCNGTETQSALAIVAAGILELTKKNTPFIFATHLHQ